MKDKKFRCAECGQEFETAWSDDEARQEFGEVFPENDIKDAFLVCDDCYEKIMRGL